jgi:hypothetical protein
MTARDRALVAIVPLVLVVVSVIHQVRVRTLDQSSWHGSGFGMFATFDGAHSRVVLAWRDGDDSPLPVVASDATTRARILPSRSNARAVAEDVAAAIGAAPGERLRVEVRGIAVDPQEDGLAVSTRSLVTLVYEVPTA